MNNNDEKGHFERVIWKMLKNAQTIKEDADDISSKVFIEKKG